MTNCRATKRRQASLFEVCAKGQTLKLEGLEVLSEFFRQRFQINCAKNVWNESKMLKLWFVQISPVLISQWYGYS